MTSAPTAPDAPATPVAGMPLVVNGEPRRVPPGTSVHDLVLAVLPRYAEKAARGLRPRGVAVAIDDVVVPRSRWEAVTLVPDARVEVVTAVQGG